MSYNKFCSVPYNKILIERLVIAEELCLLVHGILFLNSPSKFVCHFSILKMAPSPNYKQICKPIFLSKGLLFSAVCLHLLEFIRLQRNSIKRREHCSNCSEVWQIRPRGVLFSNGCSSDKDVAKSNNKK